MTVVTLLTIMFFHWVADFIFQTDWMAKNKSKDLWALTNHVLVYMAIFYLPSLVIFPHTWAIWMLGNGALHWVTDYFTSRASAPLFAKGDYHNGFVVVGLDQFLHLLCLTLTTLYLSYA